jgi:hypothetical protein
MKRGQFISAGTARLCLKSEMNEYRKQRSGLLRERKEHMEIQLSSDYISDSRGDE